MISAAPDGANFDAATVRQTVADLFPELKRDLCDLVRIASVSGAAFDPAPVQTAATHVAELLRAAGMPQVEIATAPLPDGTDGAPAVIAHRPAPNGSATAPTVLLYAHLDVQPPGEADLWHSAPFEPVERDGRLFGRGAADDKAGIVAHLGAIRALTRSNLGQDVAITVLIEGEEEIGSPSIGAFLDKYREKLAADVVVVADSINWDVGVPALTTSLRGLVDAVVEVSVLHDARHSGIYGGPVLDALTVLSRLLAALHDESGRVAIAGLRGTEPPADLPKIDEAAWRREVGALPGVELAGSGPLAHRLWYEPALAVIGIDAPTVAAASNTIVPAARAKLSLRIGPGQDPATAAKLLRDHLQQHAPLGATVTVHDGEQGKPFAGDTTGVAMAVAQRAFTDAWGTAPVEMGIGASIPVVAEFAAAFPRAEILITGVEDPGSNAHAPNESVHLADLANVVTAETLLLARLGREMAT